MPMLDILCPKTLQMARWKTDIMYVHQTIGLYMDCLFIYPYVFHQIRLDNIVASLVQLINFLCACVTDIAIPHVYKI
jgi:hypothetical protein